MLEAASAGFRCTSHSRHVPPLNKVELHLLQNIAGVQASGACKFVLKTAAHTTTVRTVHGASIKAASKEDGRPEDTDEQRGDRHDTPR